MPDKIQLKDIYKILKTKFGYDEFRAFQKDAVQAILNNQDLLMILPTGGGKSLCYQLPAILKDGVTIVISPLLALMNDQVRALKLMGIPAEMIGSLQDSSQQEEVFSQLKRGELKLLYIAPERFTSYGFLEFLKSIKVASFVIDEAHCVSQWGHEFREDYRKLSLLRENFPDTPISAFTATATSEVKSDISKELKLKNPLELHGLVYRKNLHISSQTRVGDGIDQIIEFVSQFEDESGIIYAFSRKQTESLSQKLISRGIKAKFYHAGMPKDQREKVYESFMRDETHVIVATVAFGMGIDKSNIRYVIHAFMPQTIESYYQEIGRAGRDGLSAKTLLLYNSADGVQRATFLEDLQEGIYKQKAYDKLERMISYSTSHTCRHKQIAEYFNQTLEPCQTSCDNCTNPKQLKDITKQAQMFLSAIYRSEQKFGKEYIIDLLRASKSQKMEQFGGNKLSVYGIGKDYSKRYWQSIAELLLEIGAIERGEYRNLILTNKAIMILKGTQQVQISEDRLEQKPVKEPKKPKLIVTDLEYDSTIYEKLKTLRKELADRDKVPAYIVFSDKTLLHMASKLPKTKEEMLDINGVGEVKFEKYAKEFLKIFN